MAALRSRCGHYIFALWFLSIYLLLFLPRLISAIADWMSTILAHMVWHYNNDHLPVVLRLHLPSDQSGIYRNENNNINNSLCQLRWDKANLQDYDCYTCLLYTSELPTILRV